MLYPTVRHPQSILLLITPIHHPCMSFISHTPAIVAGVFIDGEYAIQIDVR